MTTMRAGNACPLIIAHRSGPMPAGSPAVTAMSGVSGATVMISLS